MEGLGDAEGLEGLAFPANRDTASGVVLRGGLVGAVGTYTYQEEAVARLVGAVEQCREGKEDTFQVQTSGV